MTNPKMRVVKTSIGNIVENPNKEEYGFEILKMSLLQLQVCSKLPKNEIESQVNRISPSGTRHGWQLETKGKLAPIECEKKDGNKHYLFSC